MSDKPTDQPKPGDDDKEYWTERRFTDNGIAIIDGEVIYDGEAEAFGVEPLVWFPMPEGLDDIDFPEDSDEPDTDEPEQPGE
jgi:hypothetical protein